MRKKILDDLDEPILPILSEETDLHRFFSEGSGPSLERLKAILKNHPGNALARLLDDVEKGKFCQLEFPFVESIAINRHNQLTEDSKEYPLGFRETIQALLSSKRQRPSKLRLVRLANMD